MANGRVVQTADRTIGSRQLAALLPAEVLARPGYRALADAVRTLILDGRIALHVRLPAERELADAVGASRATVTGAYDLLRESGYVRSRRGSGTWTELPEGHRPVGAHALLGAGGYSADGDPGIDLAIAAMGAPDGTLADALTWAAPRLPDAARTPGYHPFGLPDLRTAVAERFTRRGLPTRPEQILVTSGAQQALALVVSLLCRAGDRVVTENPTYANALDALRHARLRTGSIAVSDTGWDMEIAESTLRQTVPRLAYVIPDFHNPTGALMPEEERLRLLAATRRTGTWLVVDETIADIALDVPAPAPLASLAPRGGADHVVTIGSLSKTHWGGLRVGWVRATAKMITELTALRVSADMTGSVLDQLVALPLLDGMERTLPARLTELRSRRSALVDSLQRHTPEWSWQIPPGGLSLWVDLGEPVSSALAERAAAAGVHIGRGARFGVDPGTFEHRLRIPYTLPADRLDEGVRRLATAFHDGVPLPPSVDRPHWVA
ncbi:MULTISPECIES: PLP-dependent aminotransferase family protein [Streptomyces]|uniref:MocR-like transcription factor YczR n=1 Tax=Streptomyces TaxID=1883 RepID=UPI0006AF32E8|nr:MULTISPECIES: PLP-dependent aminotransferase family protein [unclassified Streptomyces]KOU67840.1 GntR family transcriptional regulator [Streptomyces sp. IGB124]KOU88699.1 GntR family transcriptional regulator [Streptomyces sp. XY58]KOV03649.1 GntR family transcriptional regulator [Streptomyces sp. XY37]KOV33885.1 GntR family transcriptional regulator [Streptomyces sp. H021]KOV46814.1 GntR family transcriptional regulator [Streptomyces sp. MMG1064]